MKTKSIYLWLILFLSCSIAIHANTCETAQEITFDSPIQVDMTLADVATVDQINDGQTRVSHWLRLSFTNGQDAGTIELDSPLTETLQIAVYYGCNASQYTHSSTLLAGETSFWVYWTDNENQEIEDIYLQCLQLEDETSPNISFTIAPEKRGCADPCSGSYDPYATLDIGVCTFDAVIGSEPHLQLPWSPFNLSCGSSISMMTDDFFWRPCTVPTECENTYTNGVAWGDLEDSVGEHSVRVTSSSDRFVLDVFSKIAPNKQYSEIVCVGSISLVNEVAGTYIYEFTFEMEEGLNYIYACSINDDDDFTPTFPSASLSLSLHGCLPPNCLDENACNYDPNSDFFNQECVYPGCSDPMAVNFDINAACSNGACNYNLPGDLDGNDTIDAEDLLIILGSFGCLGECPGDIDGDGIVNVNDLLTLLTGFGI